MPLKPDDIEALRGSVRSFYADDPERMAAELAVVDAVASRDPVRMAKANAAADVFRRKDAEGWRGERYRKG